MNLFTNKDFRVFAIPGFQQRMDAIRTTIRPKLFSIGEGLAPALSVVLDRPLWVHVARHARRTVNPPDDTWTALGCDSRGYKKDVHFRVSVSRNCVRLLFEAGPEYYAKAAFLRAWNREESSILKQIAADSGIGWFKDEHAEEPANGLLTPSDARKISGELIRRRDGQLVLGRRIGTAEFVKLNSTGFQKLALKTFTALAPLFDLHEKRTR